MKSLLYIIAVFLIVSSCDGAAFLSKWLLSSVERRQSPTSLWQCPALPPDLTYCSQPHLSSPMSTTSMGGGLSSLVAVQEANVWIALLASRCHANLMKFVCSVHKPVCLHSHQVMPIQPCREFCVEVKASCLVRMNMFGFNWPAQFECDRFPKTQESMCIGAKEESAVCAPCKQEATRKNIIEKFCQADFAVKTQISNVEAFGNTSSLLVTLDRVSERLLPQFPATPPSGALTPRAYFVANGRPHPAIPGGGVGGGPGGPVLPPSTGFVDTNDDRLLMHRQQLHARRLKRGSVNLPDVATTTTETSASVAQTVVGSANSTTSAKSTIQPSTLMASTSQPMTPVRRGNGSGRKRRRPFRKNDRRSRRVGRSSFIHFSQQQSYEQSMTSGRSMLLECAGCGLHLPTSPMAPNSATRWLIMGKKVDKARFNQTKESEVPDFQITFIMPWQKETPEFRDTLREIRAIPQQILCDPNTKVELNLDAFRDRAPSGPASQTPQARYAPRRTSWTRNGWSHMYRPSPLPSMPPQRRPTWNLPAAFDGIFQNDAANQAVGAARPLTKQERRRRRRERRRMQVHQNMAVRGGRRPSVSEDRNPVEVRRGRKRKSRAERQAMLAKMTPEARKTWKEKRRERRMRRRMMRQQRQQQQTPPQGNQTSAHFRG